MIFTVELEKYMVSIGILDIIINELRYGKKPCSIILLKIEKSLEVNFHCTILPFSLTVCLQVEGGRDFLLDIKEIA